ncbi:MAG: hypothetical protein JXB45_07535 [Candidatus Krumholzibacteriota bacterium]|nr:hypothetical protein [Candidatus Krumholzibacteriota bacterium]
MPSNQTNGWAVPVDWMNIQLGFFRAADDPEIVLFVKDSEGNILNSSDYSLHICGYNFGPDGKTAGRVIIDLFPPPPPPT